MRKSHNFLTPIVLLRTAGLPLQTVTRLNADKSAAVLSEIIRHERWCSDHAEEICAALFNACNGCEELQDRRAMLQGKRDIHNDRKLSPDLLETARRYLSHTDWEKLTEWSRRRQCQQELQVEGETLWTREAMAGRTYLQHMAANPTFLKGIGLASTSLFEKLNKYSQTPLDQHHGRLRKVETNLLAYLSRMATKTSPFSVFTSVVLGRWSEEPMPSTLGIEPATPEAVSQIHIGHLPLRQLQEAIRRHPLARMHLPLWVNAHQWVHEGQRYIFQRLESGQPRARISHNQERLRVVAENPGIAVWCKAIRPGETYLQAMTRLATPNMPPEKVIQNLDRLIELGILHLEFHLPEQRWDLLSPLIQCLATVEEEPAPALRQVLTTLRERYRDVAAAGPQERVELIETIHADLRTAFATVEAKAAPEWLGCAIYEDVTLAATDARVRSDLWRKMEEDIRFLQRMNPIYDTTVVSGAVLKALFVHFYGPGGRCDNVLAFYERCRHLPPGLFDVILGFGDVLDLVERRMPLPELAVDLATIRELRQRLAVKMQEAATCPNDTWQLPKEWLHELLEQVPERFLRPWSSTSYLVQVVEGQDPLVVVNAAYKGFGQFLARFATLVGGFDPAENPVCQALAGIQAELLPQGHEFGEILGVFSFNGSLHPPLTPVEIPFPGTWPESNDLRTVPLSDLRLVHDSYDDQLQFVTPDGRVIHPVYLGMLNPFLLPPFFRFLLLCSGTSMFWDRSMLSTGRQSGIATYPRVCLGRLVLQRRNWVIPREHLPVRSPGATDFQYALAVNRWREQIGLPTDVFVRVRDSQPSPQERAEHSSRSDFAHKPQFVNFTNPFLLDLFEKHISLVHETLVIEEMLPGPDDQALTMGDGPRVTEILFECNERR